MDPSREVRPPNVKECCVHFMNFNDQVPSGEPGSPKVKEKKKKENRFHQLNILYNSFLFLPFFYISRVYSC